MATKSWKGFLQFGAVSIPVYLNVAARDGHDTVELHKYHRTCGSRVKMPTFCPECQIQIENGEIVKGYDTGNGYVPITKEEIESITPASEKVIEITECVEWADVDPVYLAESFYLLPEDVGREGYALLNKALTDSGRVAIAQLTKNNREHIVLIRPRGAGLMAHFIFYPQEINSVPEFDALAATKISASNAKLAAQLVENMAAPFIPGQFENGYAMRLRALIASKLDSKVPAPTPVKKTGIATPDLTAALQASLTARPRRRIALDDEVEAPKSKKKSSRKAA